MVALEVNTGYREYTCKFQYDTDVLDTNAQVGTTHTHSHTDEVRKGSEW